MSRTKLDKWAHRHFSLREPAGRVLAEEFHRVLGNSADERPLQAYFAAQPALLAPLAPLGSGYWCLDRPPLGAELVPDFLLASRSSAGFRWAMIELEGPNECILTKAGLPARKLAEASKQVRDWRTWIRTNIAYARDQLGFVEIDGECRAYIIIGRRAASPPKQAQLYRELSDEMTTIMTYDRLYDLQRDSLSDG